MKFHRIALRDYKGIRSVTLSPLETGVTIVEGENEVGKSSIAEALWLVFDQNDDSSSQLVRGLKPAGRDAATEIEIEASTGPYRFRYFKRFHRSPRTELEVFTPQRETFTGREAHNRARKILEQTIDRALWEALRVQQGESLESLAPREHQSLLSALDVAASETLGGDREKTLFERVQREYDRYFTSSGRERASGDGPNAPRLRRELDEARAEVDRIETRISGLERRAARSAELNELGERLRVAHGDLASRVTELEEAVAARRACADEANNARANVAALRATADGLQARIRGRTEAQESLQKRLELRQTEDTETTNLRASAEAAHQAQAAAEAANSEALTRLEAASNAAQRADEFVRLAERQLQVDQMTERLERVEKHGPELRELVAWLNACTVDQRKLDELADAERAVTTLQAQRDAEGASIEISGAAATEIRVDGKAAQVAPGQALRGRVPGETRLELPGGLTVVIRAGARAREAAAELERAEARLAALLKTLSVESADDARAILLERTQKDERRRNLAEQMRSDLRDLTAEQLREKLERETRAIAALTAEGDAPATLAEAKARREQVLAELTAARAESTSRAAALAEARGDLETFERKLIARRERLAALDEEIARLRAEAERAKAEGGEELTQKLEETRALLEQAGPALRALEAELAASADRGDELRAAAAELRELDVQAGRVSLEQASIAGVLEEAGAEGLHGQLVEAELRRDAAAGELAAFERRAAAARRLFDAMQQRRDEARDRYAEPLRRKLEALGRRVFGESFAVELTDDMRVARVSRNGLTLDINALSVGVREQISVLTRLACAALVSGDGGAPVVLDDIFGWADPVRLEKLGPILADSAAGTQVLLFTCHPQRFESVTPARVISLPSGRVTERGQPATEPPATLERPAPRPASAAKDPAPQAAFDLFAEPEPARLN